MHSSRVVVLVAKGENRRPDYLAVHPRGFVPVLALDDGQRLTEAAAVLLHIARRYTDAGLLPDAGTVAEARVFEWLMWLTNTLHVGYAGLWRPESFTDNPDAHAALIGDAKERIDALDHEVETRLGGPYAAGEAALDAAARHSKWAAWARRMEDRPAVARVLAREGVSLWH